MTTPRDDDGAPAPTDAPAPGLDIMAVLAALLGTTGLLRVRKRPQDRRPPRRAD